ncbi:hypothetical protein SprV_1002907200 [Sparganum proliferum]
MDKERPPKWVFSGDAAARSYAAAYPCRLRYSHERDSTSGLRRRDADGCFSSSPTGLSQTKFGRMRFG